jgi:hypothetical protein
LHYEQGNLKQALASYNRAFEHGEGGEKVVSALGASVCCLELGQWANVEASVRRLQALPTSDPMCVLHGVDVCTSKRECGCKS